MNYTITFAVCSKGGKVLAVALLLFSYNAQAHHSFAMYDQNITHTLTGKLTRFIVGANHSQFIFEEIDEGGMTALDAEGNARLWGVETGSASSLARRGVTLDSFPVGTYFRVSLNPLRDGRPFGVMQGGIVLCGNSLPDVGCNKESGTVFLEP